ncbi:VOC family protein [Pseudomonas sp. OHS18]|uniref:VOC family protein n=1 Tax=Pseudomonas sp. OHS18 TaxID=3399679 RepID=UPI003A898D33
MKIDILRTHISLFVTDPDASALWYADVLGMHESARGEAWVMMAFGSKHHDIALIKAEPGAHQGGLGLQHYGLEVAGDMTTLRELYGMLLSKGWRSSRSPTTRSATACTSTTRTATAWNSSSKPNTTTRWPRHVSRRPGHRAATLPSTPLSKEHADESQEFRQLPHPQVVQLHRRNPCQRNRSVGRWRAVVQVRDRRGHPQPLRRALQREPR